MYFYNFFCNTSNMFFRLFYEVKIIGLENIPTSGRTIICSNHVGLTDPVLLAAMLPRKLNYMAKKELFKNKFLGFAIRKLGAFPVDRDSSGLSAIKTAIKILKDDKVFAIFPEGRRVKEEDSESVKPGIAMISIKGKSSIIPIYIDTEYKIFKKIKINIGEPLHFDEYFDKKLSTKEYETLSLKVLKAIYELK